MSLSSKKSTVSHHSSIGTLVFFPWLCSKSFQWDFCHYKYATNKMRWEHWIMIEYSQHNLYFADSFSRPSFLKYQNEQLVPERLQSHSSVCRFYAIYLAFHLFKFGQEEITGVHDVNVLSFISKYSWYFTLSNVKEQVIQSVFVICTLKLTIVNINTIFLHSIKRKRYRERKSLTALFLQISQLSYSFIQIG